MGQGRGHLLLRHHQAGAKVSAGDMVPPGDEGHDPGLTSNVATHVRLAPTARAIGQILAVHVYAVEGVGGRDADHAVDVVDGEPGVLQGRLGRLEGQLLGGLLGAPHEPGQPRAQDRYLVLVGHAKLPPRSSRSALWNRLPLPGQEDPYLSDSKRKLLRPLSYS